MKAKLIIDAQLKLCQVTVSMLPDINVNSL